MSTNRGLCDTFRRVYQHETKTTHGNFYRRILEAHGTKHNTLVTADKALVNFKTFTRKGEMDGIILFRSPQGTVASDKKRKVRDTDQALRTWHVRYRDLIPWSERWCRKTIYVNFEAFCNAPQAMMQKLLQELELPSDVVLPENLHDIKQHLIATNSGAATSARLRAVDTWNEELDEETLSYIQDQGDVMELYEILCERAIKVV